MVEQVAAGADTVGADRAPCAGRSAAEFIAVVLGDTEETWTRSSPPRPSISRAGAGAVRGRRAIGVRLASSASGPFYCPGDQKVYLDLSFFRELDRRFGAPGDFAQAYVVAHEVGHHVQNLLGINRQVQSAAGRATRGRNALSVHSSYRRIALPGRVGTSRQQEQAARSRRRRRRACSAAAAIGDDRLTKGRVSPDSFTHGTSQQRAQWLRQGLSDGRHQQLRYVQIDDVLARLEA